MAELKLHKCKLCGEPLDITKAVGGAVQCGYCGTMYTLPKETADDRLLNFLDSGELSLDKGDFEGAMTSYSKAAEIDGNEPEANFGKALSKFKVRYIKDEVANRLQPICYEVTDKKFSDDPDYMRAYMKATPEQRAVYEEKAKDIDYIQSEFYNLKKSGLDYDCFICVKVTDDKTHAKTEDSKDADYIYHLLKDKGYKPFYSEYEIRNKQGADYEAHILYALYTSECMLVVCSDEEYLQTKWVKNEYSRFLKLVNDEEKDSDGITIVFKGKPIEKLPGKRGKLQGINFELRSADGQIVEFVDSHTPAARAKRAAEAEAKAKAAEEQKRQLAEQRRALEEQQRQIAEQLAKLNNAPSGNISYDELAKKIEEQRITREREEAERKRQEEIKLKPWLVKPWLAPDYPTLKNYDAAEFEISGTIIKKYTGNGNTVKIPYGVTKIGDEAFRYCENLNNIIIPDSVTSFGESSFSHIKNFTGMTVPDSVTSIGDYAFSGCENLINITISDGVTSIGIGAFSYCPRLENIFVSENNRNFSSLDGVLYSKDKRKLIKVPSTRTKISFSENCVVIGQDAFSSCNRITEITIPDSIIYIGEKGDKYAYGFGAFSGCRKLESITISKSVNYIGSGAFEGCYSLKGVYITDMKAWCNINFDGYLSNPLHYANKLYLNNSLVTKLDIPQGVTKINSNTFEGCTSLTSVTLPNGLTSISFNAFNECTNLTSIILPESITDIWDDTFMGCTSLTIYCSADKKPSIYFHKNWDVVKGGLFKKRAKVIWGYKG